MATNARRHTGKKPTILIIHNYYQIPGGEDTVVANEKKLLEDNGHKVILYTRDNGEINRMSRLKKLLLPFMTIYNPHSARDVKKIIKKDFRLGNLYIDIIAVTAIIRFIIFNDPSFFITVDHLF